MPKKLVSLKHYAPRNGLAKDWSMLPFILRSCYGYDSTLYLPSSYELTDSERHLLKTTMSGHDVRFFENDDKIIDEGERILMETARDIDVLFLFGLYPPNIYWGTLYKTLNPDGIVYVKLDANPMWVEIIDYQDGVRQFFDYVDLITAESMQMCKRLNYKFPRMVDYVPNGFHPELFSNDAVWQDKRNVLLTVGRLGTKLKATDVLLEAFALAAGDIPGWELRLVGPIEAAFQPFIDNFFVRNPHLRERIVIVGEIRDKAKLLEEYKRAKVFLLSSQSEAMAHVYFESLVSGCTLIATKLEGTMEITDNQTLGRLSAIHDMKAFASLIVEVCHDEGYMRSVCERAPKHADANYNWIKIGRRVDLLLKALEKRT